MSEELRPPLVLTPGEPAGIGPDLCVKLAQNDRRYPLVAVCSPSLLQARARLLGLQLNLHEHHPDSPAAREPGHLSIVPVELAHEAIPGTLDPANAGYVLKTLQRAVSGCLSGEFAALVTGPVHKGVINDSGTPFSGHTEYLAELAGGTPVMMLACPQLRVALATTHLPLAEVSRAITRPVLEQVIRVLNRDLRRRFGLADPRILVCGLNPHAGEGGHLGREEIEVIEPVVQKLCREGIRLEGPLPADTIFTPRFLARADAVLAMYHDQGLPVLKHLGFGRAVNITLGLPIIRSSVDHGTALELAGTGRAEIGSLLAAIDAAQSMSHTSLGLAQP